MAWTRSTSHINTLRKQVYENKNRLLERQHDVLRLCADTELGTPDADAAGNVKSSIALRERTIGAFVDGILNPRDGPHLAVMRMTAELEIDSGFCRPLKVIGLVVEEEEKPTPYPSRGEGGLITFTV